MLAKGAQTPLVAEVILLTGLVGQEFIVLFVDAVVGQMHELVGLVDFLRIGF
jgi:hypothetical protein